MSGEGDRMDQEPVNVPEADAERAGVASRAWEERWPGPMTIPTTQGDVCLEDVAYRWDPATEVAYLEVTVGGPAGGDPHFRVVNPPLLVEDPEGGVELRGRRWREDPLAALAEVIGRNGGAMARRGRRMR